MRMKSFNKLSNHRSCLHDKIENLLMEWTLAVEVKKEKEKKVLKDG